MPRACPFCGHTDWALSPSGKHLVCRKCGRIVITLKPGKKPSEKEKESPC